MAELGPRTSAPPPAVPPLDGLPAPPRRPLRGARRGPAETAPRDRHPRRSGSCSSAIRRRWRSLPGTEPLPAAGGAARQGRPPLLGQLRRGARRRDLHRGLPPPPPRGLRPGRPLAERHRRQGRPRGRDPARARAAGPPQPAGAARPPAAPPGHSARPPDHPARRVRRLRPAVEGPRLHRSPGGASSSSAASAPTSTSSAPAGCLRTAISGPAWAIRRPWRRHWRRCGRCAALETLLISSAGLRANSEHRLT